MQTKIPSVPVEVGQVWQDWDSRRREHGKRWVEVVDVAHGRARCVTYTRNTSVEGGYLPTGRETLVRVDRFRPTSTGFRLVKAIGSEEAP